MPDVIYKLKTEGAETTVNKLEEVSNSFKGISRDIDSIAGDGASKFAKFTSDVLSSAAAFGTGGLAGATALVSTAVGLVISLQQKWTEEVDAHKIQAEITANAEKKWLEETQTLVSKTTTALKIKNAEETRTLIIVKQLELARIAGERSVLASQLKTGDNNEVRKQLAENGRQYSQALTEKEKAEESYRTKQNIAAAKDILDAKADMAKEVKAREDGLLAVNNANSDAYLKDLAEKKAKLEAEAAIQKKHDDDGQKSLDKRARDYEANKSKELATDKHVAEAKASVKEQAEETAAVRDNAALIDEEDRLGKTLFNKRIAILRANDQRVADHERMVADLADAEKRATAERLGGDNVTRAEKEIEADNELRDAKIANRKAVTDAAVEGLERQKKAEELATKVTIAATYAELAKSAAMMVAQPVLNEVLNSERELLMLNRETFKDYKEQDWAAIIAQKTQAILTGIAVEATGRAVMEGGEALASLAAGLAFLAIPGGQASATAMFGSAAQHAAAAAVFGGIAGVSGGAAIGVGSMRGEGGLVGLTAAEKKSTNPFNNNDGSGSRAGRSVSGSNMSSGGPTVQYTTYYYGSGAVDASEKDQRNRTVQAANRDNALNPFAQRESMRAP